MYSVNFLMKVKMLFKVASTLPGIIIVCVGETLYTTLSHGLYPKTAKI